jgi:hypothetical protein
MAKLSSIFSFKRFLPTLPRAATPRSPRRRSSQRRGRRVAAWTAAFLVLSQLATTLVLDYRAPGVRHPEMKRVEDRLHARANPPEILAIGSSRMGSFIEDLGNMYLQRALGDSAPRVFRTSILGGDSVQSEWLVRKWLGEGYRPKLVVVEIGVESLNWTDPYLHLQAFRLLRWSDWPEIAPSLIQNGNIYPGVRDRLLPVHFHRGEMRKQLERELFGESDEMASDSEWSLPLPEGDPEPPPPLPQFEMWMQSATNETAQKVRDYDPSGVAAHRLEKLLALCRDQNIPTILYVAPVTSGHRAGYSAEARARFDEYMEALRRKFGCPCYNWVDTAPDKYFYDSHHLNPAGSIVITRRLSEELIIPQWRSLTGP